MFHVTKGCVGLKIDNCDGVTVDALTITNVKNYGVLGSGLNGETYYNGDSIGNSLTTGSNSDDAYRALQKIPGYQGCLVRGVSLASCQNVGIDGYILDTVYTQFGAIYGIDIRYDVSNINKINNFTFKNLTVGNGTSRTVNYSSIGIDNPTIKPVIKCINIDNPRTQITFDEIDLNGNSSETCIIYYDAYQSKVTDCSNNCLLKGSIVHTEAGRKMVQDVTTDDTINGLRVVDVLKKLSNEDLILIQKNALGLNQPNKDTYITVNHKVFVGMNTQLSCKKLLNNDTIRYANIGQSIVYNIELEKYSWMLVNNLRVETYQEN